ncbi:hypothetical protein DL93DRAFT_2170816 [Clavulina sp. PMI_390]|nr:hypothetical protein DL93DRAFT_2170816 [Clavulina sp. PMI_390]
MLEPLGYNELKTLISYLEQRKGTSDPKTFQDAVDINNHDNSLDDPSLDYLDSLSSHQHDLRKEIGYLRRTLAVVEVEVKQVDFILARAANRRAPINKLPEQILGDIFEWCCLSVDPERFSDDKWSSRTFLDRERARLTLLGICHWWFVVLTNRASIWRHVYALSGVPNRDPEAMAMVTRLRLERAKEASLAISIRLLRGISDQQEDPSTFYAVDHVLAQSFHRCETLHVNYRSTPTAHPLLPFPPPDKFPALTSLSIQWSRDYYSPGETRPPTVFSPGVLYPQLQELSLHITTTYRHYGVNTTFADLFGLDMVNVSAITTLDIDFDYAPDGTWSLLEHFDGLSKLTLHRRCVGSDWPHSYTGVSPHSITLRSLRIADINDIPYLSSLVRLKAPELEELVTYAPMDSGGMEHEEVLEESLTDGLFSLSPPSFLVTLRIALYEWAIHRIPEEHWNNFFAAQKRLEILQCPCGNPLVKLLPSIPEAFPRLRLLHLGAEYAFDRRVADDVSPHEICFLGIQLEALRPDVSSELPETTPGLRVLVQLHEESDRSLLPDDFPLPRFRVTPYDKPWDNHPVWE